MTLITLGPFCLDARNDLLLRGTEPVALGKRAILLLRALVERPGVLVTKDALIEAAWPGLAVADNNLTVQIAALRRVFAEVPGGAGWIETMPRRGYRFVGPLAVEGELGAVSSPIDVVPEPIAPAAAPSIAVLPFQNMSSEPDQDYFVDGTVEEIITALARIRWLFVLARNSSFTYKGRTVDIKRVGRELGVRYVLEGSVRKAGHRVRITGQLIDATTGAHLWADRFDGSLEDIFDLQDAVASSIAGVIEPTLQAAEAGRSAGRPTTDLPAYDLYLRASAIALSSPTRIPEALLFAEEAIRRDPRYGPALVTAALLYMRQLTDQRSEEPDRDCLRGADLARRALAVAGDDANMLANVAYALAYFGEDIGAMMALVDRALALNPNYARGWHISGALRLFAGQPDVAIAHVDVALRLSPRARVGTSLLMKGAAYFVSRRFDEAVPILHHATQDDPGFPEPYRFLAACYAQMGRLDDAKEMVERLRAMPVVIEPTNHWLQNPEHRELFLSGLRLAVDGP